MTPYVDVRKLEEKMAQLHEERDEARNLARKMYQALIQFPTSIDELISDWPEEEPIWLWRTS